MLFYTQLKREFTPSTWKKGQTLFRDEQVRDVKLDGARVTGRAVREGDELCDIRITTGRGTILDAYCSCDGDQAAGRRCEHVAALSIWVVERGSLLRAGIAS